MSPERSVVRVRRFGQGQELKASIGIALLVLLLVGAGASFAARWTAQQQSLSESERRTGRMAEALEPNLAGFLAESEGAEAKLDDDVETRMRNNPDLTEVTVWSPAGEVLYSNNTDEIGEFSKVEGELADALRTKQPASDIADDAPEADEAAGTYVEGERYVEVYVYQVVGGYGPVAVEAYYDYDRVEELTSGLFKILLPLVLLPLLILSAIQLPIAASLNRRVRRHEQERSELLEGALAVSDRERGRFAADLHDGPIQDLAGIGYALGVISPSVSDAHRPLMGRVEEALQRSIGSLRGLMTDLYPPDLQSGTLGEALEGLTAALRADGVQVELVVEETPPLSDDVINALYRAARESLANVSKHANATAVEVRLEVVPRSSGDRVRLSIADDGDGVDPARLDRRAEGHLGLRLIIDRVVGLGGTLTVLRRPTGGTAVTAEVPVT